MKKTSRIVFLLLFASIFHGCIATTSKFYDSKNVSGYGHRTATYDIRGHYLLTAEKGKVTANKLLEHEISLDVRSLRSNAPINFHLKRFDFTVNGVKPKTPSHNLITAEPIILQPYEVKYHRQTYIVPSNVNHVTLRIEYSINGDEVKKEIPLSRKIETSWTFGH